MVDLIVERTNRKIQDDMRAKNYSEDVLKKSPHFALTDEVQLISVSSNNLASYF
jgi:hypothetical protein